MYRAKKRVLLILGLIVVALGVVIVSFVVLNWQSPMINVVEEQDAAEVEQVYHGKSPNCPEKYCVSVTVNGDLLFHPALWNNFVTNDEREFDFTSLFAAQPQYYDKSDIAVCDLETPIADVGGPYTGYPVFNIPPQVLDATKGAGYTACTTDTNHSWDQGVAGIERIIDKLDTLGIKHTGVYKTEEDSQKPMILETEGGSLAIVGGTVSLNGMVADTEWRVDRMRDGNEADYNRMVSMAKKARLQGANLVVAQLHSVQEYITHADGWQQSVAHQLIDSGEFDLVYFHGSHSVQPIDMYNDKYIIYGLGNSQTVSAPQERYVNNQGLTVRIQFASENQETWGVAKISYLPTFNKTGNKYAWCPLDMSDENYCVNLEVDQQMYSRMEGVLFSMNVGQDNMVVKPWIIKEE